MHENESKIYENEEKKNHHQQQQQQQTAVTIVIFSSTDRILSQNLFLICLRTQKHFYSVSSNSRFLRIELPENDTFTRFWKHF